MTNAGRCHAVPATGGFAIVWQAHVVVGALHLPVAAVFAAGSAAAGIRETALALVDTEIAFPASANPVPGRRRRWRRPTATATIREDTVTSGPQAFGRLFADLGLQSGTLGQREDGHRQGEEEMEKPRVGHDATILQY